MANLAQDKADAVKHLRSIKWVYVASILEQMSIQDTNKAANAWIDAKGGATIYVGTEYHALTKDERISTLVHEARHIPQIATKELIDMTLNIDKVMSKITSDKVRNDFLSKTGSYLAWKNSCDNLGMDAEINQDLESNSFAMLKGDVFPRTLPANTGFPADTPPSDKEEYGPYIQYCMDRLLPKEPPPEDGDQEGGSQQDDNGGSNLNPEDWQGVLKPILDKAEDAVAKYVEENITYVGKDIKDFGRATGADIIRLQNGKCPSKYAKQLREIHGKIRPKFKLSEAPDDSYGVVNLSYAARDPRDGLIPGSQDVTMRRPTKKAVVVMDSSGSMWNEKAFKVSMAIAAWFEDRGLLEKLYCCDTELVEVKLGKKMKEIRGGGGTEFGKRHVDKICNDCGEKDFDVVYITDGELDLREANSVKTVHIVVVDV